MKELDKLCELREAGTFMAQCGEWGRMEYNLFFLQNGKEDECVAISEAGHLHKEDKRSEAPASCKVRYVCLTIATWPSTLV